MRKPMKTYEQRKAYHRAYSQRIREEAISKYSYGMNCCACCGEYEMDFLAIDHINGGGNKHRKTFKGSLVAWLKRNGYPKGFQVLCHNCNMAKSLYGRCPHKNLTFTGESNTLTELVAHRPISQ